MTPGSGLRRDAEDNRQRLLDAAREVFGERGLGATLHDVASHAGVGVATAYRRFANKDELIDAIQSDQVDELEAVLRSALDEPDPWTGLVDYMERSLAIQAKDRAIAQILSGRRISPGRHDWQRDRLAPLVDELADRVVSAGVVRPDLTGTDLIFLQIGLSAIATTTRAGAGNVSSADTEDLYRRHLWMVLDGLRAGRPMSTLPVPPLTTAETHAVLSPPPA